MSKSVPFVGVVVSGIVGILFLADLAVAIPFSRVSLLADVGFHYWMQMETDVYSNNVINNDCIPPIRPTF